MNKKYQVGEDYKAKNYLESGYNFPEGSYRIKAIVEGFPEKPINHDNELKKDTEQWIEGYEEYKKVYEGMWYYLEFPKEDYFEWIPEVLMKEAFE